MTVMSDDMSDEARQAVAVLTRLADELIARRRGVIRRLDYFRGRHPLTYASPEFMGYFGSRFAGFADNWTEPVASSPAERMNVLGIRLGDDRSADADLVRAWRAADAERGSSETWPVVMAASRAYCLVWEDPTDDTVPRVTWERPDQAIVAYDSDTGVRAAGLKLWADDTTEYATLYTPEAVWKFTRRRVHAGFVGGVDGLLVGDSRVGALGAGASGWQPRQGPLDDTWPVPNPLGRVPLVELRNRTLLDDAPLSDIDGVIAMQDAINLVWAYLLNALDYASLPQRIVMGADIPKVPQLDTDGNVVGYAPVELDTLNSERILWIPGPDARVGEWSPAQLDAYSAVVERAIEHIAAQTRTPPHYLIGKIQNVSSEALTAAETGLVSKTRERIVYVTAAVREIHSLMAAVLGDEGRARAARSGEVLWADVQFRALSQKVDALAKMRSIGFPLEWIAEQYGLDPVEVARVMAMAAAEAERDPMNALVTPKAAPDEESAGGGKVGADAA